MISGYIYAVLWFILAGYLFYMALRVNRFFFLTSAFFLFLGVWALANELTPVDLMGGVWGIVYRCVAAAVLVITVIFYYRGKKNG